MMKTSRIPPGTARAIVMALALFSFALSVILSWTVFERLPHLEDELAYLFEARVIAGGNFVIPSPEPSAAYWQPFVVDQNGLRFGKYTPGYPLQLAAGVIAGAPWIINAFFAALSVALVYRIGREIFKSEDTGVIAAALVAFSPMAILLNASLMGHSAALFWVGLFLYAYWRLDLWFGRLVQETSPPHPFPLHEEGRANVVSQGEVSLKRPLRPALRWGALAGFALGMVFITRPATALAVAVPIIAWSGVCLLRALRTRRDLLPRLLAPLAALSAITILLALIVPLYSYQATGDPQTNLYTFVWSYDRVGFGEGYGRHGHTLEKGVRHMRFDLSLTAADLFGWQLQSIRDDSGGVRADLTDHFVNQADYYPATGLSWILLPFAFIVVYKERSLLIFLWLALGLGWLALPFLMNDGALTRVPAFAWVNVFGLLLWLCAPLLVLRGRTAVWTWLLAAVALSLIIVQLTYWIGSQRYSTRYYFEALFSLAILSALPLAWLIQRLKHYDVVYAGFAVLLALSFFNYSLPRVNVLHGFNLINRELVDAVEARREPGRDLLVLVSGDNVRWRSYGELMALTSPYLDSDIVVARVSSQANRDAVIGHFPTRQIIEIHAVENDASFVDTPSS
ncbi:MAG: hypothetical protein IAE89_02355 [Anaerolineae bacterium]|nr:hypothetical protein [Anaerolineae bacterium]